MEKKRTVVESIKMFDDGEFDSNDRDVQINAGWYDWFCKDSSLASKTQKLYKKLKQIADSKKFDKNTTYVFFKNKCPMSGSLYDSFSICNIKTGDLLYWVTPSSGHNNLKGKAQVASKDSDYETVVSGSWKDVKDFFMK
jgi:hypothetical protein